MSYLKLLKLLYLSDRKALLELGRPISFDRFVSMPNGPVLSRTYDLIAGEPEPGFSSYWRKHISPPQGYDVELVADPSSDQLSPAEEAVIDQVFSQFGDWNRWKLVRYSHRLPEYRDPEGSSIPIPISDILLSEGWTEEEAKAVEETLAAEAYAERVAG